MANAKLSITMNRTDGTISVDSVSTRIYTRDENVDVIVNGFTTGESALVPYLQLCKRGVVMAQCSLTVPTGGDGTVMDGTMSTNTVQLVKFFNDSQADVSRLVGCRVFATDAENPFAYGDIEVYNFPAPCGSAPDNLVSGSEALAEVEDKIDDHIDDVGNPHEVTAAQVGAIALPSSSVSEGKVPISNGDGTVRWGSGGGSGGTSNYNDLSNKPQINGVTLQGIKTASDLSLVKTDDSRLTDARMPTAHKNSHKTGQADALSPADIGAAAAATTLAGYGITDAKISNGTITLGNENIVPITSHQDISGKVDKESGKGLSSNDYTAADKAKLAGIAAEATKVTDSTVSGWGYTKNALTSVPQATLNSFGGIKADKRDNSVQTQEVKIDEDSGKLYVEPSGSSGEPAAYLKTASVSSNKLTITNKDGSTAVSVGASDLGGVVAESGKRLMTDAEGTKLSGIADGATNVTQSTVANWGFTKNAGTYSKPDLGIPSTDMTSEVQISLGKADSALQSLPVVQKSNLSSEVQTSLGKADSALQSVPVATGSSVGGIIAEARDPSVQTQAVRIGTDNKLYVAPGGGGSGSVTSATINGSTKTPVDGVLPLGNYVDKDTSTAQSIVSQLSVGSLYVGGTRVEVVNLVPDPPVADTLYFLTGS